MAKWLLIALTAVTLGGCVTDRSQLPLALAPSDTAQAACLGDAGAPAFGDCKVIIEPGALPELQIDPDLVSIRSLGAERRRGCLAAS